MPFKLETQRKRCSHLMPRAASPWAGQRLRPGLWRDLGALCPLLCDGRGWHLFLLTSDNSEPYFPKVAEEQCGPGGLPEPQGVGGGAVTGICCPLPRPTPQLPRSQALAPSPLVAASAHLLEENPSRGADARVPATGPLCTEQACPLHVLLWFGGPAPVCSLTLV